MWVEKETEARLSCIIIADNFVSFNKTIFMVVNVQYEEIKFPLELAQRKFDCIGLDKGIDCASALLLTKSRSESILFMD